MSSEDTSNTVAARTDLFERTALDYSRTIVDLNNMRKHLRDKRQRSVLVPSSSGAGGTSSPHMKGATEQFPSSQGPHNSGSHGPESHGRALLQALNEIIRMRKNFYDKAHIYIYASPTSTERGKVLSTLVKDIEKTLALNPRSESESKVLSPANLSPVNSSAIRKSIEEELRKGIFTQDPRAEWWDAVQVQLEEILQLLPPEPIDSEVNSDIDDLTDWASRGDELHSISIHSSPVSGEGTATPPQQTAVTGSEATGKDFHDWHLQIVPHCLGQVEHLFHSMLHLASSQARSQNEVLKLVDQWVKASQPDGRLWRIFKSGPGAPASPSREDYMFLANLCGDMLKAKSARNYRTIRYTWVHLMKEPADVSCRAETAEVLKYALQVLQTFAKSKIGSEGYLPSDGTDVQVSSSVISHGAGTDNSVAHETNARVAYSYFQRSLEELTSHMSSSNPFQHGDSSQGV